MSVQKYNKTLVYFTNLKEKPSKQSLLKQLLLMQSYFSFIHCHLNYANIAWASTYKSKLERCGTYNQFNDRFLFMRNHYFMT